jgi:hypothetical protein
MGLRANETLSNAIENGEIIPGGKYFITTGKDFPYCRTYIYLFQQTYFHHECFKIE